MAEVKVIGTWVIPFVTRVRIALNLKGVDYEFIAETFGTKSELFLKSNPTFKTVPILLHNGNPVCESMVIVQYIDETWPSPSGYNATILPASTYDRAMARSWAVYIDDKWFPGLKALMMAQTEDARTAAEEQLSAGMPLFEEAFKKCSKGKDFFSGDTIGYLDIALGSHLGWLRAVGEIFGIEFLDVDKTPQLVGWAERFRSHEAVKDLLPETSELLVEARMLMDMYRGKIKNPYLSSENE